MANALAKCRFYALCVRLCHRQQPLLHSITFGGNPALHKLGGEHRKSLYPRHQHAGIHTKTSV